MRLVQNVTIPTYDTIRYHYLMELLLTTQKPVLVFGEGASGKSSFIKDTLFHQMKQYAQKYFVDHGTCSHYTDVVASKLTIERNLEIKKINPGTKDDLGNTMNSAMIEAASDTGRLKPPGDQHKLIVYYEDMHMSKLDKYGDMPGLEVIRDLLTTRSWYSGTHKS